MTILGIETSCDETAVAIVENGSTILANEVASSAKLHEVYGGVVPEIASRMQIETILPDLTLALKNSGKGWRDIDAIAVTQGPGLIGSLIIGVQTAKTLAVIHNKPLISVNHLLGHLYANYLEKKEDIKLPAVGLVISGGHTDLVYIKNHGEIYHLGGTIDDASGEAFDKAARMLGFSSYLGGALIQKNAEQGNENAIEFTSPMINSKDLNFSFSGLKTQLLYYLKDHPEANKFDVAASFQKTVAKVLVKKTLQAIDLTGAKTLLIGGGVACNSYLASAFKFAVNDKAKILIPHPKYCGDNATFIASCAYYNQNFVIPEDLRADPSLNLRTLPYSNSA